MSDWTVDVQTVHALAAFPRLMQVAYQVRAQHSRYRHRGRDRQQEKHCLLKISLSGEGNFRDAAGDHRLPAGRCFLCHICDQATEYFYPPGGRQPWSFVYVCFIGDPAIAMLRDFVARYGPVHDLPLDRGLVPELLAWKRLAGKVQVMSPGEGARVVATIFASLFEAPKGGTAAQRRSLRRRGSVLDANLAEVRRLEKNMGTADKGRLNQYLTSVREAEIRTRRADAWLDTPLPAIAEADRKRTNRDIAQTLAGDYFRTVYDLMVLAFQTDLTRVATFSLGGEGDAFAIPEIGITESRHQLSHHGGDAGYMEKLTNYDAFAIEQYSYFLTRLSETKDLNGKPLLNSTMALFGSGMCYGHSHGNANLPLVLAGGSDLGLKHGSHLDFNKDAKGFGGYSLGPDGALTTAHYQVCSRPVNSDAHMSNLLLLMAQRMGVETDQFGDSNKVIAL